MWKKSLLALALTSSFSINPALAQVGYARSAGSSAPLVASTNVSQAIDSVVNPYVSHGAFSGVVMLVKHGQILFQKGYGYANFSSQTPVTTNTRFAISALTQPFTAVAIVQLAEQGKLNIDNRISSYIPNVPSSIQAITIRELLTQTSGAPANASQNPLPPGTQFRYSTLNYALLGQVIQTVSGEPYETYVQQHILTPLGMTNTGFITAMSRVQNAATGYTLDSQNRATPYDLQLPASRASVDGLYSTADDLFKLDQALDGGSLVNRQDLLAMFRPDAVSVSTLKTFGYGFGWGVTLDASAATGEGVINGYHSYMYRDRRNDSTLIVLSNEQWSPIDQIAQQLDPILLNAQLPNQNAGSTVSGKKEIVVGGAIISTPFGRISGGTTYMPIWYIGNALKQFGITPVWDFATRTWSLTLPSNMTANFSYIGVGSGNIDIYVNGQLIKRINAYAWLDPGTNYKSSTMYAPIYYIQQILNAAGIHNTWDGEKWVAVRN